MRSYSIYEVSYTLLLEIFDDGLYTDDSKPQGPLIADGYNMLPLCAQWLHYLSEKSAKQALMPSSILMDVRKYCHSITQGGRDWKLQMITSPREVSKAFRKRRRARCCRFFSGVHRNSLRDSEYYNGFLCPIHEIRATALITNTPTAYNPRGEARGPKESMTGRRIDQVLPRYIATVYPFLYDNIV